MKRQIFQFGQIRRRLMSIEVKKKKKKGRTKICNKIGNSVKDSRELVEKGCKTRKRVRIGRHVRKDIKADIMIVQDIC